MTTIFSKAEDIAEEIVSRMQAITIENDAETDIGLTVYQGRRKIDPSQIPCSALIEGDDQPGSRPGKLPRVNIAQRYVLVGYSLCDPSNPNTAAHAVIRDLKRAIFRTDGKEDATFGGKVLRVDYEGRDIGPRADGGNSVMAVIEITVNFVEALANP